MALHGSTHLQSIGKLEISGVRLWVNQHNYNWIVRGRLPATKSTSTKKVLRQHAAKGDISLCPKPLELLKHNPSHWVLRFLIFESEISFSWKVCSRGVFQVTNSLPQPPSPWRRHPALTLLLPHQVTQGTSRTSHRVLSSSSLRAATSSVESRRISAWTPWPQRPKAKARRGNWGSDLGVHHRGGSSDPGGTWANPMNFQPWSSPASPVALPWLHGWQGQWDEWRPHARGRCGAWTRPDLSAASAVEAHSAGWDHPGERCTSESESPGVTRHSSGERDAANSSCNSQLDQNMRYPLTTPLRLP